jgi:hypothetical protein
MRGLQVRSFLKRANDFLSGMKLFADAQDDRFKYSAVLLAVHSAISYGDALCVGLGATEGGRRNHKDRVPELRKLLSKRRHKSQQGIKHFEDLLRERRSLRIRPLPLLTMPRNFQSGPTGQELNYR